ncbi:MAG: hypothetical protein EOO24_11330 [Comamonadaceae bacterium]|nr:MAG: hypothetical protein EOO24_11330 [Comamonadaceae bacterium]
MSHEMRLCLDTFEAKSAPVPMDDVVARAVYVVDGALALRPGGSEATAIVLGANSGMAVGPGWSLAGGSQPARVLRWEVVHAGAPHQAAAPGVDTRMLLSADLALRAGERYLLRCDRVDFPAGGEALTHTHQGGGIRCLLAGSIRIDTQGHSTTYAPMGAWFEAGPDPVYAAADAQVPSAFARCMVLPAALLGGRTSIRYVNPDDLDKPKSQRYQLFVDLPIEDLG